MMEILLFLLISYFGQSIKPLITTNSFDKTLEKGTKFIIKGSSFTNNGPYLEFFDDFELEKPLLPSSMFVDSLLSSNSTQFDDFNENNQETTLSHSGSSSFGCCSPYKILRPELTKKNVTEVFMSYWIRIPPGTKFPNAVNEKEFATISCWKFVWLMDGSSGYGGTEGPNNDLCIPSYIGSQLSVSGNSYQPHFYPKFWDWEDWFRFSFWLKADVDNPYTGNGMFYFQGLSESQGIKEQIMTNKPLFSDMKSVDGTKFTHMTIPGWIRDCNQDNNPLYDDFYMAVGENSNARVEIGNNKDYKNCTKLSLLLIAEWSDKQISGVLPYLNNFSPTEDLFVFVINKDNEVSDGFHVKSGIESKQKAIIIVSLSLGIPLVLIMFICVLFIIICLSKKRKIPSNNFIKVESSVNGPVSDFEMSGDKFSNDM